MKKKKGTQLKLIQELKKQLLIQAERLGIRDRYAPLFMEEMKLDNVRKILTDFYMERANLEYEMNIAISDKKEVLIKLERLNAYIRKAEGLRDKHLKVFGDMLDKQVGDKKKTERAVKRLQPARVRAAA